MRVYINGQFFDRDISPIVIIFKDDKERRTVAYHLSNMEEKEGIRLYTIFADKFKNEIKGIFQKILANDKSEKKRK